MPITSRQEKNCKEVKRKEKNMEKQSIGSWDQYTTNFLKALNFKGDNIPYVVIGVTEVSDSNDRKQIRLELQNGELDYVYDLNKTNTIFLMNTGTAHPKNLIGKKIFFKKVMARDPKKNCEVESLRIAKVE